MISRGFAFASAALLIALAGCGGDKVRVVEAYALDMPVFVNGRPSSAVVVAVRTKPAADTLDLSNVELVGPDGKAFGVHQFGQEPGDKPVAQEVGKMMWAFFVVPQKAVDGGGLELRIKSTGAAAALPAKLTTMNIDALDKR